MKEPIYKVSCIVIGSKFYRKLSIRQRGVCCGRLSVRLSVTSQSSTKSATKIM